MFFFSTGYFSASQAASTASACSACPSGSYSADSAATTCLQCLAGTYASLPGSSNCTDCPPGTYQATVGSDACMPCASGWHSSTYGGSSCVACDPRELCPLGSAVAGSAELVAAISAPTSASPTTTTDPLHASTNRDSAGPLEMGVAIGCSVTILIIGVLYAVFRRVPRVKACLRDLDVFYDLVHHIGEGGNQTRQSRGIGGFFSVVALLVMVALVSVAIIEYALVPTYVRSLSPEAAPFQPVGLFNFSLRIYGAPSCDSPAIQGPSAVQLQGASSEGWDAFPDDDSSCTMYWSCTTCIYDSSVLTVSFAVSDPNIYAAGMEYSLTFPAFSSSADGNGVGGGGGAPFVLTGSIFPTPRVSSVFRGADPTHISVSLVPVVLRSSPPQVGTFAQPIAVTPGSQANGVRARSTSLGFLCFFSVRVTPVARLTMMMLSGMCVCVCVAPIASCSPRSPMRAAPSRSYSA